MLQYALVMFKISKTGHVPSPLRSSSPSRNREGLRPSDVRSIVAQLKQAVAASYPGIPAGLSFSWWYLEDLGRQKSEYTMVYPMTHQTTMAICLETAFITKVRVIFVDFYPVIYTHLNLPEGTLPQRDHTWWKNGLASNLRHGVLPHHFRYLLLPSGYLT